MKAAVLFLPSVAVLPRYFLPLLDVPTDIKHRDTSTGTLPWKYRYSLPPL